MFDFVLKESLEALGSRLVRRLCQLLAHEVFRVSRRVVFQGAENLVTAFLIERPRLVAVRLRAEHTLDTCDPFVADCSRASACWQADGEVNR